MSDNFINLILKLAVSCYLGIITNIYIGAFGIAIIAAFSRISYETLGSTECVKKSTILKYFTLSFSIAMLFVHIGILAKWSQDLTIIISAIFAFMSVETYNFLIQNWSKLLSKIIIRINK